MTGLVINIYLVTMMVVVAVLVLRSQRLFAAIVLSGAYSLISAAMFVNLDAVDVAFTEAAVGAGVSTVLLLAAMSRLPKVEKPREVGFIAVASPLLVCLVAGGLLMTAVIALPPFGAADAPAHLHVAPRYLEESLAALHIPNAVTTVLASYRGFDTLGEVIVVFAAGLGVLLMLSGKTRSKKIRDENKPRNKNKKGGGE
ncbi:MAG: DUF4040 domain-containing protein [Candidatus Puniceispirillales bacterium WSBS_2018_MAG_OTU23]